MASNVVKRRTAYVAFVVDSGVSVVGFFTGPNWVFWLFGVFAVIQLFTLAEIGFTAKADKE
jgi:4-hydroxybenzoate polyprenyltransferase